MSASPLIVQNKKASHNYHLVERYEAGIELKGTEIKSIRQGKVHISEAFARVEGGQCWLYGMEVSPWQSASWSNHASKRPRRLLLHKREILQLSEAQQLKGMSLVAVRLYWKDRRVKLELATAKGKADHDKRHDLRKRDDEREMRRAQQQFNQGS